MGLGSMISNAVGAASQKAALIAQALDTRKEKRTPYTCTPEEKRVMKLLEEPKRVREVTLQTFEPLWTKCILYAAGIQHLSQLISSGTWEPRRVEDWLPLPVINKIQSKVQRAVDFFTRKRPTGHIEPKSRSESDLDAAELAEQIQKHLWALNDEDELLDEAAVWLITTGNCFKRHFIDTTARSAHRTMQFDVLDEPLLGVDGTLIMGPDGMPVLTKRWVPKRDPSTGEVLFDEMAQGDVASEVCSPLAMTVPLAAKRLKDAPWVMQTELFPVEHLRFLYPEKADHLPEEGTVVTSDLYIHRLVNLLSAGPHGIARTVDPYLMIGYSVVNLFEMAPTVEFKNGLTVVEAEGIPLMIEHSLALGNRFSYEHAGYYRVPARFWFRGMVEDLIHPQDAINKLEQFCELNDAFNSNPVTYVPNEAEIAEGALKNKPGLVVRYTYPYKPDIQPGTSLPPQILQRRAMYEQDVEDISGVRNVLMGNAPPGVTAGVALNRLGEESEGMFDPITKRFDRFIERCETSKLMLVERYYTEPRYMALEAEGGNVIEFSDFRGSDLRGNIQWRVEAGSYQPRSKAGLQQMLFDAYDRGLFPNLFTDPGQYAEFMDQLGVSGFYTEQGLDYRRAKWENEMLARTEGWERVIRNAGDDDLVHLSTHTSYRKTKQFLRLPNVVQQRFLMHEMEHLKAIIAAGGLEEPPKVQEEEENGAGSPEGGGPPSDGGGESGDGNDAPAPGE